ncbi:MAG TPA: hypothetical protein VEW71_07720 [Allosphingosinicella sp.]|nr:hypothetical protein [Allosphingosinicella sp.]
MAHRPFNRRQALQNAAFLEALRQTGNPRLAARLLGVHRSTYTKRRARSAAFAQGWDAALAAAHAAFHLAGGPRPPENPPLHLQGRGTARRVVEGQPLRTKGGELCVGRTRNGRLQLRRAPAGWMTKAGEQAFFSALSATANVRLSAAAAGFSHSSFYARRRARRVFAREMRLALAMAYDRIEGALLASTLADSHEHDSWRHNDPPPIPPMTPDQAIQLLHLHEKSVRQGWEQPHRRKRRNEPWETYTERLRSMWTAEKSREADDEALRRAAQYEATGDWRLPEEPPPPELPPLHLVTGWSKAAPVKAKHNPDLALFGGWRLRDWEKKKRAAKG